MSGAAKNFQRNLREQGRAGGSRFCLPTKRARSRSFLFHVKRKRGSTYLSKRLLHWQSKLNLVAPSTLRELWTRHIADSLQLLPLAPQARVWVDFGSGGGFPGMPIACALAEQAGARVHLIESNGKKAAFLREAVRATGSLRSSTRSAAKNLGKAVQKPCMSSQRAPWPH